MKSLEFKQAGFGLFIHFGLYSVLAGEYGGERCDWTEEWIMSRFRIPIKEYEKLATVFNPIYFNADEIVELAIAAGMKYLVFTAKHHEGFCLFDSNVDGYNSVKASPCKRDFVKEIADACHKRNFPLGLYYSHELDWHEAHGGGYSIEKDCWEGKPWSNLWDFPDKSKKNFAISFEKKTKPQLTELLTNYGKVDLIWCDCPTDITKEQSVELYNMIKSIQPECLVCSRIGVRRIGIGDFGSASDNDLKANAERDWPFEVPLTLNDTWGYKAHDQNWKTPDFIIENLQSINARGGNLLLNIGPDHLGRVPVRSAEILKEIGQKIK